MYTMETSPSKSKLPRTPSKLKLSVETNDNNNNNNNNSVPNTPGIASSSMHTGTGTGIGSATLLDGSRSPTHWYHGGSDNQGVRNGKGRYIYKDICAVKLYSYDGNFNSGIKSDSKGKFFIEGNSEYVGNFVNGEITGEGGRSWTEPGKVGSKTYKGEWLKGEMHGKGVWTLAVKNERYEGEFARNKREGCGILYRNDEIFKGMFTNHVLGGLCSYTIQNKVAYEGEFVNCIIHGYGKAVWNKSASYEGFFDQGLASGKAFFSTLDCSYIFEGRFNQGQLVKEDVGAYIWSALDRSMCPAIEDPAAAAVAAGGKKPAAAPAGKKGGDAAAPISTITTGECLGKVSVKLGIHQQLKRDIDAAKAIAAGGGGKAPAKGAVVPEINEDTLAILPSLPDSRSVLCERVHRVRVQLHKINGDEAAAANTPHAVGQRKLAGVTLHEPYQSQNRR